MILLLRSAMIFFATLMAAAFVALADPAATALPNVSAVSHAAPVKAATQLLARFDLPKGQGAAARDAGH